MLFTSLVDLYPAAYKIVMCLTVPAAVGFPLWYHVRLRWQDSPMGRHVMGYSVVVGLLYIVSLLRVFFPGLPLQRFTTFTLAVLMMIVVWWRVIVFVKIYHQTRAARLAHEEEERQRSEEIF